MSSYSGSDAAARALAQIGTPFRLHGRTAGVALDCVGLAAHAVGIPNPPNRYSLKGTNIYHVFAYMDKLNLRRLACTEGVENGDIAVAECTVGQFHLMVAAAGGWVHSHAGLGKVVHTPGHSPWPVVALWRIQGE